LQLCPDDDLPEHEATVAGFALDTFEVTVGRFRAFVQQYNGTPPPEGAAAHPLISDSGWRWQWGAHMPDSQAALRSALKCQASAKTWTDSPGANEVFPINCVNWFEAFAFCAWDGGRLPTEAEWEYAAAGGSENRLHPWGADSSCAPYANCYDSDRSPFVNVGSYPAGAGRWGHQDLGGSLWEWSLDWFDFYPSAYTSCDNCANLEGVSYFYDRTARGGFWNLTDLRATIRANFNPELHNDVAGIRCARSL